MVAHEVGELPSPTQAESNSPNDGSCLHLHLKVRLPW